MSHPLVNLARGLVPVLALVFLGAPAPALAQPFEQYLWVDGEAVGYLEVPDSPALNPASAITIEAWVSLWVWGEPGCRTILGKNLATGYAVGVCGRTLVAYLHGADSGHAGGLLSDQHITHIAVTYDGTTQRHYVNGELVASFAAPGGLGASHSPLRIAGDVSWNFAPWGVFDEVRLWNVARTQEQIRGTINVPISTPQPGLVAVWSMDGSPDDLIGGHDATVVGQPNDLGTPFVHDDGPPSCTPAPHALCLGDRILLEAWSRAGAPGTAEAHASTVPFAAPGSGVFWFFAPDNWEVMVKTLDGCAINGKIWVFAASLTNVFYTLRAIDTVPFHTRVYFNWAGPPAPAILDTAAFPCSGP